MNNDTGKSSSDVKNDVVNNPKPLTGHTTTTPPPKPAQTPKK
jgi:hypothetical protein